MSVTPDDMRHVNKDEAISIRPSVCAEGHEHMIV